MSWKGLLNKSLCELRINLCQTGGKSEGAREFIVKNYKAMKTANPELPILVREASGIEAKLIARFDRNVEKSVSIDGLSSADIGKQLEALVGKA